MLQTICNSDPMGSHIRMGNRIRCKNGASISSTSCVDFPHSKPYMSVVLSPFTCWRLQVWDIGGQPRFRSMWERYCRGVNAIVWVSHNLVTLTDSQRLWSNYGLVLTELGVYKKNRNVVLFWKMGHYYYLFLILQYCLFSQIHGWRSRLWEGGGIQKWAS